MKPGSRAGSTWSHAFQAKTSSEASRKRVPNWKGEVRFRALVGGCEREAGGWVGGTAAWEMDWIWERGFEFEMAEEEG